MNFLQIIITAAALLFTGCAALKTAPKSPQWTHRYISGDINAATQTNYQELVDLGISGICLQTNGNWQSPEWFRQTADNWQTVQKFAQTGQVETMVQIHIYPKREGRFINLTNEDDIQMLIDACRKFASYKSSMLMLAVDDFTPRDKENIFTLPTEAERVHFNNSAGQAHGYLMKRLYEALHPEFPDLQLALVVAPYALENHGVKLPGNRQYFEDFAAESPDDVFVVWTGRNVFSPTVTAEDLKALTDMIPNHPIMMFSNCNGIAAPMPRWEVNFSPEMAALSQGNIMLWGTYFNRPLERIYYNAANIGLQHPELSPQQIYMMAAEKLHGAEAAPYLWNLQRTFQDFYAAKSTCNRALAEEPFQAFKTAYLTAENIKDKNGNLLPLKQMKQQLAIGCEFMDYQLKKAIISDTPAFITLTNRGDSKLDMPTTVKIDYNDEALLLEFNIVNPNLPEQAVMPYDYPIYLNSDVIEIFLQPTPTANEWLYSEPPDNHAAHLCFDSAGNKFDEPGCGGAFRFDLDWQVKTERTANGWKAFVTIPVDGMEMFNAVKPAPGVVWKANFHRVNNDAKLVQSWDTNGSSFHMPEYFGELHFAKLPQVTQCEGIYPLHLQGMDINDRGEIFWSYTSILVKTDANGKVSAQRNVEHHHGDVTTYGDKVYVTCSLINDYAKGAEYAGVYVYDRDLNLITSYPKLVENMGMDGITTTPNGFAVAVLPQPQISRTFSYIYEFDRNFNYINQVKVEHPAMYSGIQTLTTCPNGGYWAAGYGIWLGRLAGDFTITKSYRNDMSVGMADLSGKELYTARHFIDDRPRYAAELVPIVPQEPYIAAP